MKISPVNYWRCVFALVLLGVCAFTYHALYVAAVQIVAVQTMGALAIK